MTEETKRLLQLAAKAVGIQHCIDTCESWRKESERWVPWNPRTDDGDSRRLEVALNMEVSQAFEVAAFAGVTIVPDGDAEVIHVEVYEHYADHGWDKCAATRMAVLRVAAGVGEAMP